MKFDASLDDLMQIKVNDNGEPLVQIKDPRIICEYITTNNDIEIILGGKILVRKTVSEMLSKTQDFLSKINENYVLHVTYGYRSLEVQEKRFKIRKNIVSKEKGLKGKKLLREVHKTVAYPKVAGHPTGGAVDVLIYDKHANANINFGSNIYDYSNKNYIYNAFQDNPKMQKVHNNRVLLREIMIQGGFIPYDFEFWHFSYGDIERGFHTNSDAIYTQMKIDSFTF